MKRVGLTSFALSLSLLLCAAHEAISCNVCHSKNPTMVRMHEALQFSNCFQCHGPGKARTPEDQKTQMAASPLCAGCHSRR